MRYSKLAVELGKHNLTVEQVMIRAAEEMLTAEHALAEGQLERALKAVQFVVSVPWTKPYHAAAEDVLGRCYDKRMERKAQLRRRAARRICGKGKRASSGVAAPCAAQEPAPV